MKEDWCDFGGGNMELESFEDTAARECIEESIGTIKFWNNINEDYEDDFSKLLEKLTRELKELKFTNKIVLCINHGAPDQYPRKYHICFVKQIPWQPQIQDRFLKKYKYLKNIYDCQNEVNNNNNTIIDSLKKDSDIVLSKEIFAKDKVKLQYLEKNDISYWNFEYLSFIISTNKCFAIRSLFVPLLSIVMHHFGVVFPHYRFLVTKKLSPLLLQQQENNKKKTRKQKQQKEHEDEDVVAKYTIFYGNVENLQKQLYYIQRPITIDEDNDDDFDDEDEDEEYIDEDVYSHFQLNNNDNNKKNNIEYDDYINEDEDNVFALDDI